MVALRNVAIVAHVDHGKTTLVDGMLRQSGVFMAHQAPIDRVLDSGDLERERGITILAKNTSVRWGDVKVNIIDTPGHADFGGEVERTIRMADGALLLVDAAEGPLPQTRFVLSQCVARGFPVVVAINKIDRSDARPKEVLDEIFDLFCDLGASDAQADFPVLYTNARTGVAHRELGDDSTDLRPLMETLLSRIPAPDGDPDAPLSLQVNNIDHDEYVGRLAIGRIVHGRIRAAQQIALVGETTTVLGKASMVYVFEGLERVDVVEAAAGEIVAVAGMDGYQIGDTIADPATPTALPRIAVEEPTLKMRFVVSTAPFAGEDGSLVTSRQLRDRLHREARKNVAIRVEPGAHEGEFVVYGRGELQLAILVETMRREGHELALGKPEVVTREVDGTVHEPAERLVIDVPEAFVGVVMERLGPRCGKLLGMHRGVSRARLEYRIPSRGIVGLRSELLTETRGQGLLHSVFDGWEPWGGPMPRRPSGAIVADRSGVATAYALFHLQPRGTLFVEPGERVYEGMVVGEHNRPSDLDVNVTREKKLTNIRAARKDENILLVPPVRMGLERAMEWIDRDELMEVTPRAIRLRKAELCCNRRPRRMAEA